MNEELEQTNLIMIVKMPSNECVTDKKIIKALYCKIYLKYLGNYIYVIFNFYCRDLCDDCIKRTNS